MQALWKQAGSLEWAAPRCSPQIQGQRSHIEAIWERLDRAVKIHTQVGALSLSQGQPRGWDSCVCNLPGPGTGSPTVSVCLCVEQGGCLQLPVPSRSKVAVFHHQPSPSLSTDLVSPWQLTPPERNRKHVWPAPDPRPPAKPPPNIGFRFIKTQAPLVSCPSPHPLTGQDRSSHSLFSSKCSEWICVLRASPAFLHDLHSQPQLVVSRKAVQVPEPLTEPAAQGYLL